MLSPQQLVLIPDPLILENGSQQKPVEQNLNKNIDL